MLLFEEILQYSQFLNLLVGLSQPSSGNTHELNLSSFIFTLLINVMIVFFVKTFTFLLFLTGSFTLISVNELSQRSNVRQQMEISENVTNEDDVKKSVTARSVNNLLLQLLPTNFTGISPNWVHRILFFLTVIRY